MNDRICRIAVLIALLSVFSGTSFSQHIELDGRMGDWVGISPLVVDPSGDAPANGVDFRELKLSNDDQFLYIYLDLGEAGHLLQMGNRIVLSLDIDADRSTGRSDSPRGIDLEWTFGERRGVLYDGTGTQQINHAAIGIVTTPTVRSPVFEVALDLNADYDGQRVLAARDSIRILLESSPGTGDRMPDDGNPVSFTLDRGNRWPGPIASLAPVDEDAIRIVSWNVLNDGLFDGARFDSFERVLRALDPEIIGFQEMYRHSSAQTVPVIEQVLPSGPGTTWHAAKAGPDNIVVSRYPVRNSWDISGNGAFLLDLRPRVDSDMLVLVAHPPCCANDTGRQAEIDAMMAFVRDAQSPNTGELDLDSGSPIILLGDFNLVGEAEQVRTLVAGDISDNTRYGADFSPDWGSGPLIDLRPRHLTAPMYYTWTNAGSNFGPGRLDYFFYTGSRLQAVHSFILHTPALPPDTLAKYGMQAGDTPTASDHLPVVMDAAVRTPTSVRGATAPAGMPDFFLAQNYPNPFNPGTRITVRFDRSVQASLVVFDQTGRYVRELAARRFASGTHILKWDGRDADGKRLPSGVYFGVLSTPQGRTSQKLVLIN